MSGDVADRLRALARDHAAGRLTLEAYRRLRAPLLDGLPGIAGEGDITQPRADITQPRVAWAVESARASGSGTAVHGGTTPLANIAAPAGGARRRLVAIAAAILLIGAALLAWRFVSAEHPHAADSSVASGSAPAPGDAAASAEAIRALLQPLADGSDWSDARLRAIDRALREVGAARIAALRNTAWFDAFVDEVRSRVREQQALAGAPLDAAGSPLAALAVTLGIDPGAREVRTTGSDSPRR